MLPESKTTERIPIRLHAYKQCPASGTNPQSIPWGNFGAGHEIDFHTTSQNRSSPHIQQATIVSSCRCKRFVSLAIRRGLIGKWTAPPLAAPSYGKPPRASPTLSPQRMGKVLWVNRGRPLGFALAWRGLDSQSHACESLRVAVDGCESAILLAVSAGLHDILPGSFSWRLLFGSFRLGSVFLSLSIINLASCLE